MDSTNGQGRVIFNTPQFNSLARPFNLRNAVWMTSMVGSGEPGARLAEKDTDRAR
jgi:hypothetical protein